MPEAKKPATPCLDIIRVIPEVTGPGVAFLKENGPSPLCVHPVTMSGQVYNSIGLLALIGLEALRNSKDDPVSPEQILDRLKTSDNPIFNLAGTLIETLKGIDKVGKDAPPRPDDKPNLH
jgi:hypothetical protein